MKPEDIEIGKTYRFSGAIRDLEVVDIVTHNGGCHEYKEVIAKFASGARIGRPERVSLAWFADKATGVISAENK
jgi:hypothetical protein